MNNFITQLSSLDHQLIYVSEMSNMLNSKASQMLLQDDLPKCMRFISKQWDKSSYQLIDYEVLRKIPILTKLCLIQEFGRMTT